ncbi:PLD nuclease N-terminal domain-containing protein [Sporosarcina sp. Te-1]|uniref:PLD nuclease N-terminal domain-containing protein n=1 Tax=Sporosarcina sp. Te-1 TaxID=2818390 RepID=UPI001A9FBF80|nr:PLD nuclease N-terminal domain-containing protein [Sporosarcina sp. Te-1]QTD40977.1 PLDc_N domain-containing protein [Sporosarcina sp. Te-1]
MTKKWIWMGVVFLVVIGFVLFFIFNRQPSVETLSLETVTPELAQDTEAILYFSTTADQDMNRDGLSFAVFIDSAGKTDLFKMNGLELGSVYASGDTLYMEDRNQVFLIDPSGLESFDMPTEEHTGEVTGFHNSLFYSVNNSGFTEDGGYQSNIRVGNQDGFDTIHIPYYLHMSGIDDGELFMVTGEPEDVSLQRMPLEKEVAIEKVASLGALGERLGLSSIMKEEGKYYLLMSDTEKLTAAIYEVDEQTGEIRTLPFLTYSDADDYRLRIPFNLRNASTIYDGTLYYVDGLGEVHRYNTETGETMASFAIKGIEEASPYMAEQTFFQEGNLFVFRYDANSQSHVIDTYDLASGKRTNELPVSGLEEMFQLVKEKGKRVAAYDFFVR